MNKKWFLLPVTALMLVACGKPTTVELNARNVLGYNGTNDVTYGDSEAPVVVDGVTVSWVGTACYKNDKDTENLGFFQMRSKSASKITIEAPKAIQSITLKLALSVSNYDATKPLKWTLGEESGTVDFVKDTAEVPVPCTPKAGTVATIAYDLDDGYTYTVYVQSITVVF